MRARRGRLPSRLIVVEDLIHGKNWWLLMPTYAFECGTFGRIRQITSKNIRSLLLKITTKSLTLTKHGNE